MQATSTHTEVVKAASYTTGTVHYAHATGPRGQLTQLCGMGRRQLAYLYPVDGNSDVTCAKCLANH